MTVRATGRLTIAAVAIAGCGLSTILLARPEIAALALPFVLALGVAHLAPGPDLVVDIQLGDERIIMGDTTVLTVTLTSHVRGWATVTVHPPAEMGAQQPAVAVPVAAHDPATLEFVLDARAWGAVQLGEVSVVFTDQFGLREWAGRHPARSPLRIHPPPDKLQRLVRLHLVNHRFGAHPSTHRAEGIEFAELRPFRPGDPLRTISWRASARSDELWVTDRHPERGSDVVLLLDSYSRTGTDVNQALRWGIEASILLARSHLSAGDRVGLVELGGLIRWVTPGLGAVQLQRLVDALLTTRLVATEVQKDLNVIPIRSLPPGSVVFALSPLTESTFVDHLVDLRSRGHDVLLLDTWDGRHLPAPRAEGRRLGRQLWERDRDHTRLKLARLGVGITTLRPDEPLDVAVAELAARRRSPAGMAR